MKFCVNALQDCGLKQLEMIRWIVELQFEQATKGCITLDLYTNSRSHNLMQSIEEKLPLEATQKAQQGKAKSGAARKRGSKILTFLPEVPQEHEEMEESASHHWPEHLLLRSCAATAVKSFRKLCSKCIFWQFLGNVIFCHRGSKILKFLPEGPQEHEEMEESASHHWPEHLLLRSCADSNKILQKMMLRMNFLTIFV